MLQLYDKNKNKLKGLTKYKDYCIESVLKTGDKTLSFLYPSKFIDGIVEEGYIRNKTDEFVIKEIVARGEWTSIKVQMNVEDLEGKAWEHFNTTEQTIENCLNLACAGTGWTVQVNNVSKKRTVKKTNCSSWEIIQEAKKIYRVEIEFDTLNKIIYVKEKQGQDKGVYFSDEINLKALDIESNSYDFYTKIIAIGKENIKVEVENFQYSNKVKTLIWKDERYTVLENLREDATAKLQELSKPRKSYSAYVIDLAKLNSKYKNILDYKLGDTITLISKDKKIREKQRIVKIVEYPDEPERNSCEIANTTLDFIDIQKDFQDTADTVSNITEDNGTISQEAIKVAVKNLTIDKADINSLNAAVARIGTLEATKANITELNAVNAKITNLQANKAEITDLIAGNIKFDVATGGTLDLQTLLSKFVTGENGQFLNLTTDNVTISNALIKDVIAKSISVEDLKASTISTNKFKIASDNGGIEIVGATQQFKDKNSKVRIQMGQDTQGNFNFILRGEDGTTTLIDHTGIKEKAIADDLIKEKMIAENAVGEKQINYSSLVTGLNKDANTSLIQASKVAIDLTGQKLDVAFNSLKSTVNDTKSKTESNTTSIGVINGQIDTLIKDTIIEENGTTVKLKDSYSTLKQTVNGINATVASHTSSITNLGTNLTNAQNTANSANSLADSKAKVFTSTPTTPYKIGDIWTGGPSGEIMKCKVARASGAYVSTDWEKASKYTDDAKANAVEGNLNTLSGKVTTVESNYASLSQNLEGFKTTVASTYSTKTELSTVDGKITSLTSRVSTAESSITQLNNSIDLSVSSLKKIVQEGNNNLVANSNWFKGPSGWRLSTTLAGNYFYGVSGSIAIEDKYYIRLGHINNNATSIIYADSQKFPVVAGEKITYGGFGSALSNAVIRIFLLFTDNTADISVDNNFMSGYTWLDFTTTNFVKKNLIVTVPSGATRAFVRIRVHKLDTTINTDSSGVISSLMVRKGEEIFEWCPSQGDSFLYIDEQTANLQVNIDDITSRVSSTESSISTINGSVTGLTTRVNTVEQKVTATAITTTISSAINAGTSSITTTQFVMDKTGFTVKNGAIKIQNKAGTNVMTSDTNGNLTITGTFVNKNYNGVDAIKIQDTSIYFYDWERNGRELGLIYSSQLSDYPNVRGFSLAHNNEGYMTLGYKTSTGYNSYIVLDKYAKNPAYPAPIRVLESAVFQSAVNMQERVYVPNKICFESTYNARTPQIFKNTSDSRNILISQVSVNAVNDGYMIQSNTGGVLFSILAGSSYPAYFNTNVQINGSYTATGSKNSLQSTEHYGERLINAFETAEYYYSDIGFGKISDSGECYISIDDILQECVNLDCEYHIFTQQYNGKITTIDRKREYFVVYGEPGTEFSWQYIAKRIGYENVRLDQPDIDGYLDNTPVFSEDDLKIDTSEDVLMEELDFNLEEVLMEVI